MHNNVIGVLGGIGPNASAYVHQRLIDLAQNEFGCVADIDFPPIVVWSAPIGGMDEKGIVSVDAVRSGLVDGLNLLESHGCDVILIACNTVHILYDELVNSIATPIIHMVRETCATARAQGVSRVGVISSETTRTLGLYEQAVRSFGMQSIPITQDEQTILNTIIGHVMSGRQGIEDQKMLKDIINRLVRNGCETIIVGCTELPLVTRSMQCEVPLIDSVDVATRIALVRSMR